MKRIAFLAAVAAVAFSSSSAYAITCDYKPEQYQIDKNGVCQGGFEKKVHWGWPTYCVRACASSSPRWYVNANANAQTCTGDGQKLGAQIGMWGCGH